MLWKRFDKTAENQGPEFPVGPVGEIFEGVLMLTLQIQEPNSYHLTPNLYYNY